MIDEETFSTQNLYQGAYCLAQGFKILGTEKDGRKVTVTFAGDGVQDKALKFYNGGRVEAQKYSDAYRTLKDMVFQR